MKTENRLKRGFAMEYALAVMVIAVLFCTLIALTAVYSVSGSDAYSEYMERKNFLDEVGYLSIQKYDGKSSADTLIDFNKYSGTNNDYGYEIADNDYGYEIAENTTSGAIVTVSLNGTAVLTVTFIIDQTSSEYELTSYVYGTIYYM